jgi:hypothetical protein
MTNPLLLAAGFSFKFAPNASAPGASGLSKVVDMALTYALIAGGIGAVISIALLAVSHGESMSRLNYHAKVGLASALGAVALLGIISQILGTAYTLA